MRGHISASMARLGGNAASAPRSILVKALVTIGTRSIRSCPRSGKHTVQFIQNLGIPSHVKLTGKNSCSGAARSSGRSAEVTSHAPC